VIDVQFVYTTPEHCQHLADNLREQDAVEMAALGYVGQTSLRRMVDVAVRISLLKATIMVDGQLACIFGVSPINTAAGLGAVWLLATPHGQRHAKALTRRARPYIDEMLTLFPLMTNLVHQENTASRRWLTMLGAKFGEPVLMSNGATFIPFEMRADHV